MNRVTVHCVKMNNPPLALRKIDTEFNYACILSQGSDSSVRIAKRPAQYLNRLPGGYMYARFYLCELLKQFNYGM